MTEPRKVKGTKPNSELYWVTTPDHDEDWFIIAPSKRLAQRFHEEFEGYERGDADAELIVTKERKWIRTPNTRHAQLDDLKTLGFDLLNNGAQYPRSVRYGSRVFVEGVLPGSIKEM